MFPKEVVIPKNGYVSWQRLTADAEISMAICENAEHWLADTYN